MGRMLDLTGKVFSRLTVIRSVGRNSQQRVLWECRCTCGKLTVVFSSHLVNKNTTSCGCFHKERVGEVVSKRNTTHGLSRSVEYVVWAGMIQRCNNPLHASYHNYGGVGISVCEEWLNSFEQFYADMGPRPSKGHSIERLCTSGPYCKENCCWATRKEQNNNRKSNRVIEFNGETKTLAQWAEHLGISYGCLYRRLSSGWPLERAFTEKVR